MSRFTLLSAVHLFLIRDNQVLLLRRYQTGYEDGNYSVPAGHLDGGEPIKLAMIREAKEEIGIDIAESKLHVIQVMHRQSTDERIDFFLYSSTWTGEIRNMEPHKCDDLAWYSLDALPDNIIPYVKQAINNYRNGQWFDSFGWHR